MHRNISTEETQSLLTALETGDLKLIFHDDRSIKVHCTKIKLASLGGWLQCIVEDYLEDQVVATKKRMTEEGGLHDNLTELKVDGTYELWLEVTRLMYHGELEIGPPPSELSIHTAFLIFPIAHQYEFKSILNACSRAVMKGKLDMWPSQPIASSEVPHYPGLVQWLALADAKQCDSIVDSCLTQLTSSSGVSKGMSLIREALASPTLGPLMEGLRPETMIKAMHLLAGLPLNKVLVPKVGWIIPSFIPSQGDEETTCSYHAMSGSLLICPKGANSAKVWDMDTTGQRGALQWDEDDNGPLYWAVDAVGKTAVSMHTSGARIKIWDLENHQQKVSIQSPRAFYPCLLESKLMLGSISGSIEVWDIGSNPPVISAILEGHTGCIYQIQASASTSLALSCSCDRTLRLWDLRTSGGCVRVMEGHAGAVFSVDWDSACQVAISGSRDTTIKQWDLGSGRCVETYQCGMVSARQVIMHESGASFFSLDVINTDDLEASAEFKAWSTGCVTPLMTVPLAGGATSYKMTASSDLSCVTLLVRSQAGFKVEIWKG